MSELEVKVEEGEVKVEDSTKLTALEAQLKTQSETNARLSKQLEAVQQVITSSDYLNFLNKAKVDVKTDEPVDFENMSQKELVGYIVSQVNSTIKTSLPQMVQGSLQEAKQKSADEELEELKKQHSDWEEHKDMMIAISLGHPTWSIQKLYNEAVKKITPQTIKVPVNDELPGLGGGFQKIEGATSGIDAARAALEELTKKAKGG